MCKCCQSCFESCYWHCIEKWWCYDDRIATYDDAFSQEKDARACDNLAFWDSVAVIANRSVVTIQPLPEHAQLDSPIPQPNTETRVIRERKQSVITPPKYKFNNELNTPKSNTSSRNRLEVDGSNKPNIIVNSPDSEKDKLRKKSAIEERIEKTSEAFVEERNRKKSLKERRKSAAGLTLKLENDFHEIPVIRQNSMPKFYLDTPEINSKLSNYTSDRSSVLVSPVLPNSPTFNYDLRSVVQIEKELEQASHSKPATPRSNRSSRLVQVRKKLKPMISKKDSSKSLPDSINHM